jgi:hypothetical protein
MTTTTSPLTSRSVRHPAVRQALCTWARDRFPKLVRSAHGSVKWGEGRQWEKHPLASRWWPHGSGFFNAGVRVERGVVIVENYRGREVARVPLAEALREAAVQVVAALKPPGWEQWEVTDAVGLLAYADWLDENAKPRWATRVRRWAAVALGGKR